MKKRIYKISRWIHKYFGLIVLLFMSWMSLTGIFLNHPELIENVSVKKSMVPLQYKPTNWNRSSLKGIVYMEECLLIYGRQGVFRSKDNAKSLKPFMNGEFPKSAYGKRTNYMFYSSQRKTLLCATNQGCLFFDFKHGVWKKVLIPSGDREITKILETDQHLLLISKSEVLKLERISDVWTTKKLKLTRLEPNTHISLIQMFFELHDGSIWGLTGRLIWDVAALILLFLCISAFYIWYFPKKWKRQYKRKGIRASKREKTVRSFYFRHHKKLGWYFAFLLVIITITGMFLNPILMMTLLNGKVNYKYYPATRNKNQWNHKIRNALYDTEKKQLVLDCTDGVWSGNYNVSKEFSKINIPVTIFGMGTTVFREEKPNVWLVGSFGGLHRVNMKLNSCEKVLLTDKDDYSGRPASTFVTAYEKLPDGNHYILGHYKGICNKEGEQLNDVLKMPSFISQKSELPLWTFMFELHNARLFRGNIGGFYILIIPLAGLLSVFMLLSGVLDYWLTKPTKSKKVLKL
ncbi:hypothetical protein EYV94_13695 [Puteibacter caeruleilacunae]|nr:hypothetical protein EYV94_13695 [Puteibacter caeruleilacunae]